VVDYTSFVKRVVRLVQTYLSIKSVELEMRPFTKDDESMDTRGQPLISAPAGGNSHRPMTTGNSIATTSSEPVTSLPASAAVIGEDDDKNDVTVTSPADDHREQAAVKKKTRKKRRSSRKSEEIEEVTMEQFVKGLPVYISII